MSVLNLKKDIFELFYGINPIYIFKIKNPSGLPILPHLRGQMMLRIDTYSATPSSLYMRQPRQSLNIGTRRAIKENVSAGFHLL